MSKGRVGTSMIILKTKGKARRVSKKDSKKVRENKILQNELAARNSSRGYKQSRLNKPDCGVFYPGRTKPVENENNDN